MTIGLGAFLLAVYLANGREIGQYDTLPTTLTTLALARGEGIFLDGYGPFLLEPDGRTAPYVERTGRHIVSRYPLAPAIVAAPLVAIQAAVLDRVRPGWDAHPLLRWRQAHEFAKVAAAALAALACAAIHRLLVSLGLSAVAIPATLAVGLGSDLWTVGSQALWQHGPAALMLTLALLALGSDRPSRFRGFLGGLAAASMVACRAIDVVFALTILAWVTVRQPRLLAAFLAPAVVLGAVLVAYNVTHFNALSGGQAKLESMHPEIHGVPGPWSENPLGGLAGTLFSPARGLFVFSPWILLALTLAPVSLGAIPRRSVVGWTLAGLVPYLALLSTYSVWWAGHTFGPRYWTDAAPLFAVLLASALDWCRWRFRAGLVAFGALILFSIGIQTIGAFCFPSSWNLAPANVDTAHHRLWDWRDTEITRCLREGLRSRGP